MIWKNKKMNVLIPMAGEGSRFAKAGYTFPKPLIEINSEPFIAHVIDNMAFQDANFYFLIREEHLKDHNFESLFSKKKIN